MKTRLGRNMAKVLVALGVFTATMFGAIVPASAVTLSASGSPGTATIPFTYGQYSPYTPTITAPWRTVYLSSAYTI